jgi:hypothetical protein
MKRRSKRRPTKSNRTITKSSVLQNPEWLEPRLLLYAPTGGAWANPELVTVSFMADGTDIGGTPNSLQSALNRRWANSTWQTEMLRGIQNWAAVANINFGVVADDGSPFGSSGTTGSDNNVQGDRNFGDIRIGGFNLDSYLGIGMLPPPINGDTTAGDFFLNTATTWNMGSSYDLLTVTTHETGHVLGLDHSRTTSAEMYATYNGVKTTLSSDDVAGIQSIYGARQHDAFDSEASNNAKKNATVITSFIDSNRQISLPDLDITNGSDADFYKITIPNDAAGSMTIRMQAAGLSLLAPKLSLYNSGGSLISSATGSFGTTVQLSRSVSPGQVYYITADGADTSVFGVGKYALQVNLGSGAQSAVASPGTAVSANGESGYAAGMSSPSTESQQSSPSLLGSLLNPVSSLVTTVTNTLTGGLKLLTGLIEDGRAEADGFGEHAPHSHANSRDSSDHGPVFVTTTDHHHDSVLDDKDGTDDSSIDRHEAHMNVEHPSRHHSPSGHTRRDVRPAVDTKPDYHKTVQVLDEVADSDPLDVHRPGFALIRDLSRF